MKFFLYLLLFSPLCQAQSKTFTIDCGKTTGTIKPFRQVNVGPGKSVKGYQDIGITEIRTHDYYGPCDYWAYTLNYYNTATGTFNPSFNPQLTTNYNWTRSDQKIDSIVRFGFTPFFRLGISYPQTLTPIIPPIDSDGNFKTFASVCKRTVMHYNQGWGSGFTYNIRYWEIWNEPDLGDLFWKGSNATPLNFYKLYKAASDSVKSVNSSLKVGGPGLSFAGSFFHTKPYYDNFINYCASNNVKLDFFSWHLYDCKNPYSIRNYADTVRQTLDKAGFTAAESFITEINPDLKDNSYNDTPRGAAWVASMFLVCNDAPVDKIFWYRGVQIGRLVNDDLAGQSDPSWNGLAFKAYSLLAKESPVKLFSTGNEFVNTVMKDTTNVLLLAGKSTRGDTITLMVTNLRSSYNTLVVSLQNVPWNGLTNFSLTEIRDTKRYVNSGSTVTISGNTFNYAITKANSPSVFLLRLTRSTTGNRELNRIESTEMTVFPNPAGEEVNISLKGFDGMTGLSLRILNPTSQAVYLKPINTSVTNVSLAGFAVKGFYLIQVIDGSQNVLKSEKVIIQ